MKKIKTVVATVLALSFGFTFFGCSKQSDVPSDENVTKNEIVVPDPEVIEFEGAEEIVFTAEKPICDFQSYELGVTQSTEIECFGHEDIYEDFLCFYQENLKGKLDGSIYFITATNEICSLFLPRKEVHFRNQGIEDGKYIDPYITESVTIDEDKFSSSTSSPQLPPELTATGLSGTITLKFNFYPVKIKTAESKFRLEFGEYEEYNEVILNIDGSVHQWYSHYTYFNIYRGNDCIATCWYELLKDNPKEQPTYEWFVEFLKRNLILMR